MSEDCHAWKNGHHKNFEKAEIGIERDEDDIVLCSLTKENKKENAKKANSPQRLA